MALTDVEEKASTLLGQGGMQQPATVGPDQPEPILMAGLGDRLAAKAARAMFGEGGSIMEQSRQRARDIESGSYKVPKKGKTDEIGNVQLPPEEVAPEVIPEAPAAVSPAIEEPRGAQKIAQEFDESLPPDTPERFIRPDDDPYNKYLTVGDDDIDAVMRAPDRRDELIGGGMTDFNGDRLPDESGIQERMEAISRQYAGEMDAAKRKTVTFEAAKRVADLVGANPKKLQAVAQAVLERRAGEGINVEGLGMMESMLAARDLLVSEVKKLDDLANAAIGGEAVDLAGFRYQMEFVANLQRQIRGAKAEYARTLGGMRIQARVRSTNPALAREAAAKNDMDLRDMLDGFGGAQSVEEMARAYKDLKDPSRKMSFARGLSMRRKIGNAFYEVWQHALLTNPISQTKNIISGVYTTFLNPNLELAGGIAIGAARRAFSGADDGAKLTDLQAQMFGQIIAMREALMAAGRSFATGTTPSKIEGSEAGALAGKDGQRRVPAFSGEAFGASGAIGTGIDVLGNMFTLGRVGFRTLEGGDTFFKVAGRRGELYKNALIEGQSRGKQGEELIDFIAEYTIDPPAETLNKMDFVAKYNTLQNELDRVGKAINLVAKLPILRYFAPFIKTPYNSSKYSFVDRSLLGAAWGSTGAMIRAGGAQRDEAIARISLGTIVGGTALGLVLSGEISGGGPSDPARRQTLVSEGWQPYSFKVAGEWFSYAGMEPLSSIIGVWADVAEIGTSVNLDMEDEDFWPNLVGAGIAATMYNVSNKTFMGNFATLAEVISDPSRRTKNMMDDFVRTVVPRGVAGMKRSGVPILGDIDFVKENIIDLSGDPIIRDAQSYIEEIKAQIPSLSRTLNPAVDEYGRDKVRGVAGLTGERNLALGPDIMSPMYKRKEEKNVVSDERLRLGGLYLKNDSTQFTHRDLDEPIILTNDQRYFRNQQRGKIGFKFMKDLIENDSEYKQLQKMSIAAREAGTPNEDIDELLKAKLRNAYKLAEQAANAKLLQHKIYGPSLEKVIRQKIVKQKAAKNEGL
mgnify:CR=1 FL=1